jgi:hypothetical protein
MDTKSSTHSPPRETTIPVITVSAEEQTRRVEAAIAKRAYQIFEKHEGIGWHELEDWRQAESELHGDLCCSKTTEDHTFVVGTDPGGFAPGTLEIWVAPTRVTLTGDWHPRHLHDVRDGGYPPFHHIFRSIDLPCPVDPAKAQAYIRNHFLEIKLPQAATVAQTKHVGPV